MTAQHTPGKLIFGIRAWSDDYSRMKPIQKPFDYTGPGYYENPGLYAEDGTEVVGCDEYSIFSSGEDARRLVACWNACDGIPTNHLEQYGLPGFAQTISDLRAERDELLAALKAIVQSWDNNTFNRERYVTSELGDYWTPTKAMVNSETIAAARAAIQKATNKEQA